MEDLLKTIEQFLEFSDEKLEGLSEKNQALKLQENQQALRMDTIMTASRQILMFMKKLLHLQILL